MVFKWWFGKQEIPNEKFQWSVIQMIFLFCKFKDLSVIMRQFNQLSYFLEHLLFLWKVEQIRVKEEAQKFCRYFQSKNFPIYCSKWCYLAPTISSNHTENKISYATNVVNNWYWPPFNVFVNFFHIRKSRNPVCLYLPASMFSMSLQRIRVHFLQLSKQETRSNDLYSPRVL